MADIKWIKLTVDMFDNRKIKQIESMENGDSIIVMWLKLLMLAGLCNSKGEIFFVEGIPYTIEMLATEFNRDIEITRTALDIFKKYRMIDTKNGVIRITNWEEYQNVEGMEKIREQNRMRKQRQRERQKNLPEETVSRDKSRDVTQQNKNKNKSKNKEDIYTDVPESIKEAFMDWVEMRKKKGKPIAVKGTVTRAINSIQKLSSRTDKQIAIINQSTDKGWLSFYELEKEESKPSYYRPAEKQKQIDAVQMPDEIRESVNRFIKTV